MLKGEESGFSFGQLQHILLPSLQTMNRGIYLHHRYGIITYFSGLNTQKIFSWATSMSINQLISLVNRSQLIFRTRIFTQTQEHVSTPLIMIRQEKDQGSSFWFRQIRIICHRISIKIPDHTTIITQTLIFLHHFNLKLNHPPRFWQRIYRNNQNTSQTPSFFNLFFWYHYNWILRIIYSIIASKSIAHLTHHFDINILLMNNFSICFKCSSLLSNEYFSISDINKTITKSFQNTRFRFGY